ncbi:MULTISPECIES: hypothetical protein [unclassified Streptomyces]|uniref:hypothetical protein n=1 Tax=unclassified Streptomyces TaxID=2593676 RepID=UPI00371767D2
MHAEPVCRACRADDIGKASGYTTLPFVPGNQAGGKGHCPVRAVVRAVAGFIVDAVQRAQEAADVRAEAADLTRGREDLW